MSYDTMKSAGDRRAREAMNSGTHECAVKGCNETVPVQLLMCAAHWHRVPAPLQRAVWQTWKALRRGVDEGTWKAYEAARNSAIRSVEGGES